MGNLHSTIMAYWNRFRHDRRQRLVPGSVLLILALTVAILVYWQFRLSGIAMTNETYCGYEEHTHTEECYEYTLICELEETEGHVHDETCYDEEGNLICGLEECEPHIHSEECYTQTLTCEIPEHVHTADCFVNLDVSAEDLATLEFVGEDYIITVSYGEDAALPDGTELVAYEYAQDTENFLARYEEAAELYGWEDSDETDPYNDFRLFNIGLYYDGTEIEPAASVTVTVALTGETDAASVSVTHFTDTATETLDATLDQGDDSQSVTFTADGFSEYGIMLTSLASNVDTARFSDLTDEQLDALQIEIDNTITEDGMLTAYLYYIDTDNNNEKVYVKDYVYDANGDPTSDTTYFISNYTKDEVEYTVTYTWYRSKEPYLTDSNGDLDAAPEKGSKKITSKTSATSTSTTTVTNYNYLVSTSNSFGATVSENYCSVINGTNIYLFYYYYVGVSITYKEGSTTKTKESYESADEDTVYATLEDDENTLGSVASYVKITNSDNTLTATLYDSKGNEVDPDTNDNFTYTFTWYKSRTYKASDGTTQITASDAPYANTVGNTNDYAAVSGKSGAGSKYATLALKDEDSFYFYYLQVTLKHKNGGGTTYTATVKGYQDWAYADLVVDGTSNYTAVIVDDIASSGTFKAVLYDNNTKTVATGSDVYSWSKSESEYVITTTYTNTTGANTYIYSDQNVPADISYSAVTDTTQSGIFTNDGDAVYIAKNFGALHYYKVTITYDGEQYESAPKFVQYSDEIENGGFEIGSNTASSGQSNELYVAYWHTTNGEYSENHGTYRGYNSIEIGRYGGSTALGTYAIAYTKGGNAAQDFFVELNATEASTLYQSVITAPGNTYYWNVYHQNRSYSASNVSDEKEGQQQNDYYRQTTVGTGTDSMYVIIMSDADAEKLLADVDEDDENYDEQQDVIDAAAAAVAVNDNLKTDQYMESSETYGTIDGYYEGDYQLKNSNGTVHVTLWQVTTTKTVTRVTFYTDSSYKNYADVASLADTDYPASEGWAPITATVNSSTTTVGYYKVTDWVEYSGSYTVPDGQYLTRFFFAAAYAQGGTGSGNFIDGVSLTYAIDYTIEYWVWDYDKCEYVLHADDTENGSTTPYTTVDASYTNRYEDYGLVGSVTSYESGGSNPESFDSTKNTSLYVDAYNYVLSIYYGGPGVVVEKVISGVSTAALSALDATVNFTVTDTADSTNAKTLDVKVAGAASGESSAELDESTYAITETCDSSILDGKYLWVGVDVTGAADNNNDGVYEFEITETDPLPTVTYTNYYLPVVTLKKVDSTDSTELSGVKFVMYKITDETLGTKSYYSSYDSFSYEIVWSSSSVELTTDDSGEITYSALSDGTYYLVETGAADGYNILTETLSFTISGGTITEVEGDAISVDTTDTYGLTILVKNDPGVELPGTGSAMTPLGCVIVGGIISSIAAFALMFLKRRRHN